MAHHENVEIPVEGSRARKALLVRPEPGQGNGRGVVVIHDATGFRADTVRHCDRFAAEGYTAIAPDLFAGGRVGCVVRVFQSMRTHEGEAFSVIDAARTYLVSDPGVDAARVGVTGFCMGGGFALISAADHDFAVSAPFYGTVPRRAERLTGSCPVLAQFGSKDQFLATAPGRLASHLTELGTPHEIVVHDGVGHSFMNDHHDILFSVSRYFPPLYAGYDAPTEANAWARLLAFFDQHLAG